MDSDGRLTECEGPNFEPAGDALRSQISTRKLAQRHLRFQLEVPLSKLVGPDPGRPPLIGRPAGGVGRLGRGLILDFIIRRWSGPELMAAWPSAPIQRGLLCRRMSGALSSPIRPVRRCRSSRHTTGFRVAAAKTAGASDGARIKRAGVRGPGATVSLARGQCAPGSVPGILRP